MLFPLEAKVIAGCPLVVIGVPLPLHLALAIERERLFYPENGAVGVQQTWLRSKQVATSAVRVTA
jgi:hypothetical protein